jgi:hypothetical protein
MALALIALLAAGLRTAPGRVSFSRPTINRSDKHG